MSDLNNLIDINLRLIHESSNKHLFWINFDNSINPDIPKDKIAKFMEEKGLITIEPLKRYRCDLTDFGYEISDIGWLEYLYQKKQQQELINKHQQNIIDNNKPKEWYEDRNVTTPILCAIISVVIPILVSLLMNRSTNNSDNIQREEITAIIDSVNKTYKNQYDSLAYKTNSAMSSRLDSLETSYNKYLINNPPFTGKEKSQ